MRIAVISDTHGARSVINKLKSIISECDAIIHLGDYISDLDILTDGFNGKVFGVRGNCDLSGNYPKEQIIEIYNKRIFMCHGDKYGVKYGLNSIYYRGREVEANIVLFGHSHQKVSIEEDGLLLLNPGSPSIPKDGSSSIAFLEIDNNKIDKSFYKL